MAIGWKIAFYAASKLDNIIRDYSVRIAIVIEAFSFTLLALFPALSFYAATSWYIVNYDHFRLADGVILYSISLIWVHPLGPRIKDLEQIHL